MKKYSLTKTILSALVATAVTLLAAAPAHAYTSWVRGGHWASTGGEPNGIVYPDGITSTTTPTQAAAVADSVAADYHLIGINFVRLDVDPATITNNWAVVQAYVNELVADGLYVDICSGYNTSTDIVDMNSWKIMWQQIDGVYKNNNMVYYEPINEPYGFTYAALTSDYTTFLNSYGIQKGQSLIILQGSSPSGLPVPTLGGLYPNCTLAFHDYWGSGITTETGWSNDVASHAGVCANRCIVTEYGALTQTGLNYQNGSSGNTDYIPYLRGLTAAFRGLPMGGMWFPLHQNLSNNKRMFNGIGGDIFNRSALNRVQYGWKFFTTVEAPGCDFDTIGTSEYTVYRPSNQHVYIYPGNGGIQYGASTDIQVPANYNGTGQAQVALWRSNGGWWYIYPSLNPTQWGLTNDIPVPGDYLGNGQAQLAVWRPSSGKWYVKGGDNGFQFGLTNDIPVPGYYNNDGHLDYAVYRPSNYKWFVNGGVNGLVFGQAGDIPVPGDYVGNGTTQIAVFRPSDGTWRINGVTTNQFGKYGDVPVPGDYLGNGYTQMATWTPTNFVWSVNGGGTQAWGTTGDVPLPLPYAIRHSLGYHN